LAGDRTLLKSLHLHIAAELRGHPVILPLLANDALADLPPLTFFRGLVMDAGGAFHQHLDIHRTALNPLIAAARVFALAHGHFEPTPAARRLEAVMPFEPAGASQLSEAAGAFRAALYSRARAGAGLIEPARLGKVDQLLLKIAFAAIHRFLEFTVTRFIPGAS